MGRASWYGDHCCDCRRWFDYDELQEVRDRASGALLRVCRRCRRRRRLIPRWLVAATLVVAVVVLAVVFAPSLPEPAADRAAGPSEEPAAPEIDASPLPLIPKVELPRSSGVALRQVPKMDSSWLLTRLNAERRKYQLPPLGRDRAASLLAQENSAQMAEAGKLARSETRPPSVSSLRGRESDAVSL